MDALKLHIFVPKESMESGKVEMMVFKSDSKLYESIEDSTNTHYSKKLT